MPIIRAIPNRDDIRREELESLRDWLQSKIAESEKSLAETRDHLTLVESQLAQLDDQYVGVLEKIRQHWHRIIRKKG